MTKHIVNAVTLYFILALVALNPDMVLSLYNEVNNFIASCFELVVPSSK
jgi:hypothetical protein